MKRGEIWIGNLNLNRGTEVGKIRPVLIIQADFLTEQGEPTVVVLPLATFGRSADQCYRCGNGAVERSLMAVLGMIRQVSDAS